MGHNGWRVGGGIEADMVIEDIYVDMDIFELQHHHLLKCFVQPDGFTGLPLLPSAHVG